MVAYVDILLKRRIILLLSERYNWTIKEIPIENVLLNGHLEDDTAVLICIEDKLKGIKFPHPITHFIDSEYKFKGKALNTQKNAAREVCKFFNYINKQISSNEEEFMILKEEGINGLQPIHGARYITFLTNERDKDNKQKDYKYVKSIERYLIHFYKYLSDMDIIEYIEFDEYVRIIKGEEVIIQQTPFDHPRFKTKYPKKDGEVKDKLKDFANKTEQRDQMIVEFLRVAENTCPEIAFGIALQIFGGLRKGEVVNITSSSIPPSFLKGDNAIVIKDNQKVLFDRLKSQGKQQVKRPRLQLFFENELLRDMYNSHLIRIESRKNRNIDAFFLNKDGEAISGDSYEKKFAKAKRKYIKYLSEANGRYGDYKMLDESIWGTHICRGIFTNILYDLPDVDEKQMAIMRGDLSTLSSKEYIDKRSALALFQSAMNDIYKTDTLAKTLNFEVK